MAFFDMAQMGKDMLAKRKEKKDEKNLNRRESSASFASSLSSGSHDNFNESGFMDTPKITLKKSLTNEQDENTESYAVESDDSDSSIDSTNTEPPPATDPPVEKLIPPLQTAGSASKLEIASSASDMPIAPLEPTDSPSASVRSKLSKSKSAKLEKADSKKKILASDPRLIYGEMDPELQQIKFEKVKKRGYWPAFQILQTMTRTDKQMILDKIFIKRSPNKICYDDKDAYDILFRKIYGLRARSNTALRSVRILKQSTWLHTLQRATIALNISAKMIIYQGDWRVPTRFVTGMSSKKAMKASREDFEAGNLQTLDACEQAFFTALSKNFARRLGPDIQRDIRNYVTITLRNQDSKYADLFAVTPEYEIQEAKEIEEYYKKKQKKQEKKDLKAVKSGVSTMDELRTMREKIHMEELMDNAEDVENYDVLSIIENIEKARPGFGKHVMVLIQILALRAKYSRQEKVFTYTDLKDFLRKMGSVGAKDAAIGITIGVTLSTFVNPFLGFPLMAMSIVNLTLGSTEAGMVEPICIMQLHSLFLMANGTNVYDL